MPLCGVTSIRRINLLQNGISHQHVLSYNPNLKKKTNCLVTAEFCVRNQTPLFDGKIFLSTALLIFPPTKWWNQTARQIHTLTILRTNSLLASCPVFPDRMFSYNSPAKTSRSKRRAASEDSIEAALALLEIIGTSA